MQGWADVVSGVDNRRLQRQQVSLRTNITKRARANEEEWRAGGAVLLPGNCCFVAVAAHAICGDCGRRCAARRNYLLAILPRLSRPGRQGWRQGLHATCRAACPQRLHRDNARRIFGRRDSRRRPRRRQERIHAVLEDDADANRRSPTSSHSFELLSSSESFTPIKPGPPGNKPKARRNA